MTDASRRLDAPAFHRNHRAIADELRRLLADAVGDVLEIGSGTGQHVPVFAAAVPQLTWWPSDIDGERRASIDAWRANVPNVKPAIALDAAADWHLGEDGRPPDRDLAAVVCLNVIHIAPWRVAEGLFRGAGTALARGRMLILYGPFKRGGVHTAPSNVAFDANLRARDPDWGVRDIDDVVALAARCGLVHAETVEMPANNIILGFARGA